MSGFRDMKRLALRHPLLLVATLYLVAAPWQIPHGNLAKRSEVFHFFKIGYTGLAVHYPTVLSGDEPHYLVILNSLLEDGDLDLANNYLRARSGDWDAGFWFRNYPLDLHALQTKEGHLYTTHYGVGMPLIVAALAFPFRATRWVEPIAVLSCAAAILLALFILGRILVGLRRPDLASPSILLGGLATPVFAYARGFWTEDFTILGFLVVLWVWLEGRSSISIVVITLLTIFCRNPAWTLFAALILAGLWFRKKGTGALCLGVAAGLVSVAVYNFIYFSSFTAPHKFELGNFFYGLLGSLMDPVHGLFVFTPVLIFGFAGLWSWSRKRELLPAAFTAAVLSQLFVTSIYQYWGGGSCYANRYLHPALLPLAVGCLEYRRTCRTTPLRWAFNLLLAYSACVNIYAGFLPGAAVDRSPLEMLTHVLERIPQVFR